MLFQGCQVCSFSMTADTLPNGRYGASKHHGNKGYNTLKPYEALKGLTVYFESGVDWVAGVTADSGVLTQEAASLAPGSTHEWLSTRNQSSSIPHATPPHPVPSPTSALPRC